MPKIKAIGHVDVKVRDMRRAVDFYKKILGLKHVIEHDGFNAFEVGDTHLCLMHGRPKKQVPFDLTTEDLEALNRKLGTLGVHVSRIKKERSSGHRWFYFEDPDGHRVHVRSAHDHPMPAIE